MYDNGGVNKITFPKKLNTKLLKTKTSSHKEINSKTIDPTNAYIKFAKLSGTTIMAMPLQMQTRNTQQLKHKEPIQSLALINPNQSHNTNSASNTIEINTNNPKGIKPLNKTNIVMLNQNSMNLFNKSLKNNAISESPLNDVKNQQQRQGEKTISFKQIQSKLKPDTFQINKKLNDFLQKDTNNNKTKGISTLSKPSSSFFSFPDITLDKHHSNAQIPYEYLNDLLETFYAEEKSLEFKVLPDFINNQLEVNNRMRAIVVNWIIEVHNRFKLLPDTLFLAVLLFDRYMSLIDSIKKKKLQLIGVTSLLLACKYEEIFSPEVRDFVCILDETYERDDLMMQENDMMKKLRFEVAFPSSLKYYEILKIELDIKEKYVDYGNYLLELTLIDSRFSKYSQAVIATTVCYMVLKFQQGEVTSLFYERIKVSREEMKNCLIDICFLIDNIEESIFLAVIKKYKTISSLIKKKCLQGKL